MNTESNRRLSLWRVILAILIISGIGYFIILKMHTRQEIASLTTYKPWFAAYVDVTATPIYAFEQIDLTTKSDIVLSFIVASPTESCTPTWGSYYNLDQAAISLDLDRRIARLRQQGGKIAISFGGALNDELALKCTDPDQLLKAYTSVIERYEIDTIDLDLEKQSLTDKNASDLRAKTIARLQKNRRSQGKNLAVWLTLPVAPQGLTEDGTNTVTEFLKHGVDLAGVNVMTMDFGSSRGPGQSMLEASKQALNEVHRQLGILYKQSEIDLNSQTLWRKIGATPMLGQNDITEETFTLQDAKDLNQFAIDQGLGRMSMWSANRDIPCGENYVNLKVVSSSCSGVKAEKTAFTQALSNGFDGDLSQNAVLQTKEDPDTNTQIIDDPDKSPYQIWQDTGAYPKGIKVVWHGNVYEAKWWTKNDLPDNPVLQSWETPWQLVGPVLPGEKPIKQPILPKDTYPTWSGTEIYNGGDRILFEGIPFQAKWWNQGQSPAASAANSDSSPWLPLSQAEIVKILENLNSNSVKESK